MLIELLLTKKTNVFDYSVSSSGVTTIGNLIRKDDERGYTLDLFENESIPITYSIVDVQDPSKKSSPFTKNFLIPGTKRNQVAMGFPYMISNPEPFKVFNGMVINENEWHLPVQEAQIYVEGILTFSGKMEFSKALIREGEINSFEINFLATQINIFDEVENKKMTALDMPSPEIVTVDDVRNIYSSVNNDDAFTVDGQIYNGFTFGIPDWGFNAPNPGSIYTSNGYYNTTGLNNVYRTGIVPPDPANAGLLVGYNLTQYAYIKFLIDKIFDGVDFNYSSDFFNSADFKRILLLSYNSEISPSNTAFKLFGSSPTTSSYYPDQVDNNGVATDLVVTLEGISNSGAVPLGAPYNPGEGLMDPFHIWDNDEQTLTFKKPGSYKIRVKAVVDIRYGWDQVYLAQGGICPGAGGNNNLYSHTNNPLLSIGSYIRLVRRRGGIATSKAISNSTMYQQSLATPSTYIKQGGTHYQWEASHDEFSNPLDFFITAQAGDVYDFELTVDPTRYMAANVAAGCDPFPADERKFESAIDIMVMDVNPVIHNWEQTLPDISQRDFLSAIIKHFNIYSEITPNSRAILFEPRDDFYKGGITQDWTPKVDAGTMREISRSDPPLNVWARMKKTGDYLDKAAQETNVDELEYGSLKTVLPNGKTDDITIQSDFASITLDRSLMLEKIGGENTLVGTALSSAGGLFKWNVPNPALYAADKNGEPELVKQSEMYLVYRSPFVATTSEGQFVYPYYDIPGDPGTVGFLTDSGPVPRSNQLWSISALDADTTPGLDLNFRKTRLEGWNEGRGTPPVFDDLVGNYDEYYSTFFDNLNEQRILNVQVRLNPSDIARFSFRNPIFIEFPNGDSAYFIVSKIDYDPTLPGPYNVELLTFNKEFFDFETDANLPPDQTTPVGPDAPAS